MAIEDKYNDQIETLVESGSAYPSVYSNGGKTVTIVNSVEVAAADEDGSVYRVAKNLSPNMVIVSATIDHDSITAGVDFDFGIYKAGRGGAAKVKDVYANGVSLATAANGVSLLSSIDLANKYKTVGVLAGDTTGAYNVDGYDLALTGNTVGTVAGTIRVALVLAQVN